jgi:hypothetical protein
VEAVASPRSAVDSRKDRIQSMDHFLEGEGFATVAEKPCVQSYDTMSRKRKLFLFLSVQHHFIACSLLFNEITISRDGTGFSR